MKAAWYEKQGPARDVLKIGQMDDPQPLAGEVRIQIAASGVNPGDVKKREDAFGIGMPYSVLFLLVWLTHLFVQIRSAARIRGADCARTDRGCCQRDLRATHRQRI